MWQLPSVYLNITASVYSKLFRMQKPTCDRNFKHLLGGFLSQPPIHFLSMVHTDMPLLNEENTKRLSVCFEQSIFEPLRETFTEAQE